MDEASTIGRRIARARKLRESPLTQAGLAARVPCSKSLIAQVERGHKPATPSLIAAVARALNVDVTELTGQPYGAGNGRPDRIHAAIPQIRQALVYWDIAPALDGPPRPLAELARVTRRVGELRMQAGYTELGALLPGLIKELVVHAHTSDGAARERAFRLLADAYTAVDSMAYKLGYMDLFALAVERMSWAASQADDPLLRPVASMRRSSAFLATGEWDGGLRLLERAGRDLDDGRPGDPATLSVLGTVHLRAAVMAARGGKAAPAWEHVGYARDISSRLGRDTRDYGLLFGPTNVAIHEVAIAVELGDADQAVRRGRDLALPADLPRERSSHHYIDLSRAWLWQGNSVKALACVVEADRLAPQRTRYHPMARETVTKLLDQQRRLPEQLRVIAARMGMS
ncbi:MAG TPA: helix-turn-helix domain-containing protein [Streptosporangiaceae bacterium]|nr:helix-turn-helix domain-containing protein [Streptosporangiaceae bacterium]